MLDEPLTILVLDYMQEGDQQGGEGSTKLRARLHRPVLPSHSWSSRYARFPIPVCFRSDQHKKLECLNKALRTLAIGMKSGYYRTDLLKLKNGSSVEAAYRLFEISDMFGKPSPAGWRKSCGRVIREL